MFAHVTGLRYWKSERADLTTCEDALRFDVSRGLFCVADGAGTTLFSNLWAEMLVKQFMSDPLLSSDPFEMEWWIRLVQKEYQAATAPKLSKLDWNAKQKAVDQGAYSTLAALRVVQQTAQSLTATLLAVGDSCALIGHMAEQRLEAFPLQHDEAFDRSPYCVPALLKNLNRYTLYPKEQTVEAQPGDVIILATDAVARWIVSGGGSGDESKAWEAFLEVSQRTEDDWPSFIDSARRNRALHDDDCTALIVRLMADGPESEQLGETSEPRPETVRQRQEEFQRAREEDNKEQIAIVYGDGRMLQSVDITLSDDKREQARAVADALREVRQAMRDALNTPQFAAKVAPVWWRYADLLMNEPCAETVRKTLQSQGVSLVRPAPPPAHPAPQDNFIAPVSPLPARQPHAGASGNNAPGQWLPPLSGTDPALTTTIAPTALPPAAMQQLRERRNQTEQAATGNALIDHLRDAINREDDDALIAVDEDNKASPAPIEFMEYEKQMIEKARQRKAAVQALLDALVEGTPQQKVAAADQPLLRQPLSLSLEQQEQLLLARALVEAMLVNDDERIMDAYNAIEFSPLRKCFIFTAENQQRIRDARNKRAALQQFRAMLANGGATVAQLVNVRQSLPGLAHYLSEDEWYVVDLVARFLQLYQEVRQDQQGKNAERQTQFVQAYNALCYAPYRIAFIAQEESRVKRYPTVVGTPAILAVNGVSITISQLLALRSVKPRYAELQITNAQKRLPRRPTDEERQFNEKTINYWKAQSDSGCTYEAILDDLVYQRLLEEELQRTPRRDGIKLENEVRDLSNEILKELRAFGVELERETARFFALFDVCSRYPPDSRTLADWLKEQRGTQEILYFERPEPGTQTTRERARCWLFKWWRFRSAQNNVDGSGRA